MVEDNNPRVDASIGDGPTLVLRHAGSPKSVPNVSRLVAGDVILGRYTVVRELGEGGMGVVYQCLDTVGGVEVAVKGLPPEVSRNADEMEDIRANYQLVRKLRHPNIAGATSLERDDSTGAYYLVMDLAQGVTLKSWVRRNASASREARIAILRQVAAALDYAHTEKVIHRDVKPENVMVDAEGRVKVLDFGLAAQIRSSQSRTSDAVTSTGGTPGYKSPEQWRGRAQQTPADIYSFGVVAYWMLAGHLPFDGDDPVVLGHAVLTEPVEPVEGLPEYMNAALAKALAKKPEERFASCAAFMDALEGKGDSGRKERKEAGGAQLAATAGHATTRGARSRATVGILIVAALALLAIGGWWLFGGKNRSSVSRTGTTGVSPVARDTPGTTGMPPVALGTPGTTGIPPVALGTPGTTGMPPVASEPRNSTTQTITLPGGVKMEMIYVEPGSFTMGSPDSAERNLEDAKQHRVTLTKGYWIGKYPVTQAQWNALVSAMDVSFGGRQPTAWFSKSGRGCEVVKDMDTSEFPMESINWNDSMALVDALNRNEREGWLWSLPTEAQWEFAARGGNKSLGYMFSGGDDLQSVGWYYANSGVAKLSDGNWAFDDLKNNKCRPHSVREGGIGNELGIVGMSGNVCEWCADWYGDYPDGSVTDPKGPVSGPGRVLRGGSWSNDALHCRSAYRVWGSSDFHYSICGLRLCCSAKARE